MAELKHVVSEGFRQNVLEAKQPALILFHSKWNKKCAGLLSVFEELAVRLDGQVMVGEADGDREAEIDAWFRVINFPTAILYANEKEIARICGPQSLEVYLSFVEEKLNIPTVRDTMPDTWVAIDQMGRALPTAKEVGGPRKDRTVMMFYFINRGELDPDPAKRYGPFDNTKILKADPSAIDNPASPPWGPYGTSHYWGESQYGYYLSCDEYVIAKHAQQLCDAGVDTLVYDTSNFNCFDREEPVGYFYNTFMTIFRVFDRLRREGRRTPKVCFLFNFWSGPYAVRQVYKDVYSKGLYREHWFMWDGKPLVMYDPEKLGEQDEEIRSFFTFRRPMPDYFYGPKGPDQWAWCEISPQHAFYSAAHPDEVESVPVSVAQNAVPDEDTEGGWTLGIMSQKDADGNFIARGRSFCNGQQPKVYEPEKGANFQEQWDRALMLDPKLVFITGWNEWTMGRLPQFIHYEAANVMVDQFDEERSRDIEPSRTVIKDHVYHQLIQNVRKYKGVRPVPASWGHCKIALDASFDQWSGVGPAYLDDIGDIEVRECLGDGADIYYSNKDGRNDLAEMKVTHDDENVYFYVKTAQPLTPHTDKNWMQLLLHVNETWPGWNGFQFMTGRIGTGENTMVLERSKGGFDWEKVADISYRYEGCELMLSIERRLLGLTDEKFTLDFKWCDNIRLGEDPYGLEFYTQGDTAPNERFMYRYLG